VSPYTKKPYTNIQRLIDIGEISHGLAMQEFLNRATTAVMDGYYASEYEVAKAEGAIGAYTYDSRLPVYTFWDLGKGTAEKCTDAMSIWFVQFPGDDLPKPKEIGVIEYHEDYGKTWAEYAQILNSKGYMYGGHYAPWDINRGTVGLAGTNWTWAKESGIEFVAVPRRGQNIMHSIEICRRRWRGIKWSSKCRDAVDRLASYHEKKDSDGVGLGVPEHSIESNCADSYRCLCEALELGIVKPKFGNSGAGGMDWVDGIKMDGYFD
jgi:hypothetical protein